MPTIKRIGRYRFFFYSNEGNEPAHIHVEVDDSECKFWLKPVILSSNYGVKPADLREIERFVFQNSELFLEKYNEYHSFRK